MKTIKFSIYSDSIKSAIAEQQSKRYKKIEGKRGSWYVSLQENAADNIYFASKSKERSDGFGGRTMEFLLEDGTIDNVQGPWHSNGESLLTDTGYDIRNTYYTQGIIAKTLMREKIGEEEYSNILHYDEVPILGSFSRIPDLAQKLANEHKCVVYYAVKPSGGGSAHFKEPIDI